MYNEFKDIEYDLKKFISEQKEIIIIGGCLSYTAISIWLEYLSECFKNFIDIKTRSRIIKYKKELLDLRHLKKDDLI